MPSTASEGSTATKLFTMITNYCPHVNLATVQRKYFNESKGEFTRYKIYYLFINRSSNGSTTSCDRI